MFPQPQARAEPTSAVSSTGSTSRGVVQRSKNASRCPRRATSRPSSRLPYKARSALMRAWLAVLSARHPHVVWLPADHCQWNDAQMTYLSDPDSNVKRSMFAVAA